MEACVSGLQALEDAQLFRQQGLPAAALGVKELQIKQEEGKRQPGQDEDRANYTAFHVLRTANQERGLRDCNGRTLAARFGLSGAGRAKAKVEQVMADREDAGMSVLSEEQSDQMLVSQSSPLGYPVATINTVLEERGWQSENGGSELAVCRLKQYLGTMDE